MVDGSDSHSDTGTLSGSLRSLKVELISDRSILFSVQRTFRHKDAESKVDATDRLHPFSSPSYTLACSQSSGAWRPAYIRH